MVLEKSWKDVDSMENILLSKLPFTLFRRKFEREAVKVTNGSLTR
jgi:hypothetical protein